MDKYLDLSELLTKWNLSHLIHIFEEQNIDIDILQILEQRHFEKIYKLADLTIGQQAMFEFNLKQWKLQFESSVIPPDNPLPCSESAPISPEVIKFGISVEEVLSNTSNGKDLLKYYARHGFFNEEQRNLLIKTIVKHIECMQLPFNLTDCTNIEREICSIFPSEQIEFYTTGKRGKIYNKLSNNKRLSKSILKINEPEAPMTPEPNLEHILKILRSGNTTMEEFDVYWRKCAPLRFKQIGECTDTASIIKLWPEYILKSGLNLINIDFVLKYPKAKDFKERWGQFAEKLIVILKTNIKCSFISGKLINIENANEETKNLTILWCLHNLLPPQQKLKSDSSGAKYRKKFSVTESQESFALIGNSLEEVNAKLTVLQLQCRNIQPRLLVVGELTNVKSVSVYFDNTKYNFLTVIDAFDILFKIFFVFGLQFPDESDLFYNFIQSLFFEMPTSKKCTKISILKQEVLKLEN